MTGNWITANLQAAISFFNAMMSNLYDILLINPLTYREGAIWSVVNTIYDALLGSAISLMIVFIYMGLIEDMGDMIKHKNPGPVIWAFVKILFSAGILIYGKYLLVLIFSIGKDLIDKIVLKNGVNVFETSAWVTMPDAIVNATQGMAIGTGIVFWIVTLIAALVIMVVCFTVMLTIYGRLFRIYMHIAIAPIPLACFNSKSTMQHFMAFIRSFAGVILEGLVIIVACLIFSAFASGFDSSNPTGKTPESATEIIEDVKDEFEENGGGGLSDAVETVSGKITGTEQTAENAEKVWLYLAEMLFLFIMLAGIIKGADDYVKRWIGV